MGCVEHCVWVKGFVVGGSGREVWRFESVSSLFESISLSIFDTFISFLMI